MSKIYKNDETIKDLLYKTTYGKYYIGDSTRLLANDLHAELKGKVNLILTSPPFPLNKKKKYGNLTGTQYQNWFVSFADVFSKLLTEDGSIVIELGNAWEPGKPVQSLLHLESLLGFVKHPKARLRLCQQFICYNPARIPSPAQWVNITRSRTIDSFTHIWWMSKHDYPKADNKKVLRPYSKRMQALLNKQKYNAGKRPSQHVIGENSFLKDNGGSIMHNVIKLEPLNEKDNIRLPQNVFSIANTQSNEFFLRNCRDEGIAPHPARMPLEIANFFIEFLTDPNDLVLDPFAGSNTTGFCAERISRRWIAIDTEINYGKQSEIRFKDSSINTIITRNTNLWKDGK
jgi:DNA modification methylase